MNGCLRSIYSFESFYIVKLPVEICLAVPRARSAVHTTTAPFVKRTRETHMFCLCIVELGPLLLVAAQITSA